MQRINTELTQFMNNELATIRDNPFLEFYIQQISKFLFSGGKRIRPVLMILSYGSIAPEQIDDSIYRASLSIELLHNASLIHDDIMDLAETRRGEKAFHISFRDYARDNYPRRNIDINDYGLAMGILGGDFAYNLSYKVLQQDNFNPETVIRAAVEFNQGFMDVIKGVIFETDMQGRFEVTEKQYIEMIKGKTAALFKRAARMGAIYAGGAKAQINALGSFAQNVGVAFQIVDDIIGTFGDPKKTGKPIDSDIKEGKKTILLIKAIEQTTSNEKKKLQQVIGNRNASEEEIEEVRRIMKDSGALEYAKAKAEELFEASKLFLEQANPVLDNQYQNYLIELAKLGVDRKN